jgi:hypothetical protein
MNYDHATATGALIQVKTSQGALFRVTRAVLTAFIDGEQ